MANITAEMVKNLREKTGAGMMDCKKALTETKGDFDAAVDTLRKKGLSKAAKKASRIAAEGLIGVRTEGKRGAVVEVNSETDFVARNETFQDFVRAANGNVFVVGTSVEKLLAAPHASGALTTGEVLTNLVAKIGENMQVRRAAELSVSSGVIASYVHNAVTPDLGKIGVLVALQSSAPAEKLMPLGKQLAMHIAAAAPLALSTDALDPKMVAHERAIFADQARQSGKPENVIEKMVEGRLRKFYEESVLNSQIFVIDGETPIAKVLEKVSKDLGAPVQIAGFVRFAVGEGIEKEETDFAAEVKAAAGH
jgi:elongation factor Ts